MSPTRQMWRYHNPVAVIFGAGVLNELPAFESYGVAAGEARGMVNDALQAVRGRNFIGAPT